MAARQPHPAATICLLLIALSIFSPRRPFFDERTYNLDEGTTAVCARVLLDGGVLYRDAVDSRPPLTHYLYALVFMVAGIYNMLAVHVALAWLVTAVSIVIYVVGRAVAGWRAGVFAAVLFSVASFNYHSWDVLALHTEWLMILFTASAGYCCLRGFVDNRTRWFAGAGALYALAVFSKQPAFTDFAAAILFLGGLAWFNPERRSHWLRALAAVAGSFTAVAAVFSLYFLSKGAFGEFWFWCWTYNVRYHVGVVPPSDRILAFITNLYSEGTFLHDNAILLILTAVFVLWRSRWEKMEPGAEIAFRFLALWAVFTYVGASLSGRGRGWGHYFFQVLPTFCVAGGVMIEMAVRGAKQRWNFRPSYTFTAIFLLLFSLYPLATLWNSDDLEPRPMSPQLFPWIYPHSTIQRSLNETLGAPGLGQLSEYLHSNSGPDDTLFVWGFSPEVYVRSRMKPATRYVYCNPLTGLIPWVNVDPALDTRQHIIPGTWDLVMEDLNKSRPKFIVDASYGRLSYQKYPIQNYPPLKEFIDRHYHVDKAMEGRWRVFRLND